MNCRDFEPLLALDTGGDLAPAGAARLDKHLRTCSTCRKLARELASSQAALAALKADEPDPASLAIWRQSVLDRIAVERRPRRFIWAWAGAAAAATAALALFALIPRTIPPPPEPPAPIVARVAPPSPPAVHPAPKPHRPRPRRPAPKPKPNYPTEPLLVRLETSDPNVIIYWIAEGKGD
ncbi:MAG: anti-sigma factor family protein [Acidobacteriota bacterium]